MRSSRCTRSARGSDDVQEPVAPARPARADRGGRPLVRGGAAPHAVRGAVPESRRARDRRLGAILARLCPAALLVARARRARGRHCAPTGQAHAARRARDGDPRRRHVEVDAGQDVEPTRLGAAQKAIRTFLANAPKGLRVGLVVFAGDAQVATPPTRDHALVGTAVDEIDQFLVFGGTAIGDALQTAVELGKQVTEDGRGHGADRRPRGVEHRDADARAGDVARLPGEKSPVSILFLSDGAQTRGVLQPLEGAALAKEAGIPRLHGRPRDARGVIERGPFGAPCQRRRPADPGTARPRDAPCDRQDDGRRVLRSAHRERARPRV